MTPKELRDFIKDFKYLNREFTVSFKKDYARINAKAMLKCVDTGKMREFGDYRDIQYKDLNEHQLLVVMRNWLMILALHELDEHINYKGEKVFDPHKTLNYLY